MVGAETVDAIVLVELALSLGWDEMEVATPEEEAEEDMGEIADERGDMVSLPIPTIDDVGVQDVLMLPSNETCGACSGACMVFG